MQGSSEKRKNGYSVSVFTGITSQGKKVYKSVSGFPSREEAQSVLTRILQEKE